jgi:hypothetical protein
MSLVPQPDFLIKGTLEVKGRKLVRFRAWCRRPSSPVPSRRSPDAGWIVEDVKPPAIEAVNEKERPVRRLGDVGEHGGDVLDENVTIPNGFFVARREHRIL